MLVISRKPGESVRIGQDIEVRIVHSSPSRVRLAIEAPAVQRIWREDAPPPLPRRSARRQNDVTGRLPESRREIA